MGGGLNTHYLSQNFLPNCEVLGDGVRGVSNCLRVGVSVGLVVHVKICG